MVQVNAITDGEIAILGISAQENQVIENTISNSIIGIQLSDLSSDNLLQDNKIQQVIQGIILEDSWENMLKNNTIEEAEIAIWLKWASDNRLYKNMLTKNIQGIILKSADGNLLEGNMINNQAQSGIELLVSHENVIKDNELKANGIGIVIGADSMDNQVLENLIEGNHRVGLLLQGAVGNLVQNNQIWDQGEVGLQLTGSDENEVLSNQLQGNPKGIVIEHGWGNVVAGNVLSDHTTVGIELIESRQTQLVDNHLTARSQFEAIAIRLEQGKENILEGNEIIGHRQGIYLHQSLSNRFLDNEVQSASKEAICLSKSEDNLLLKNILRFSEAGVLLDQADTNTLKENDIHENKFGIILDRANENMLEKNQVTLNQVGIDLRQGQGNVIRANHVAENEFGILLNEMEINILEANTVERNTYGDVMILDFVPGELIVGFKEGVTQQEAEVLIRKLKMRVLKFFARFNIYHLCFPKPAQGCRLDVTAEETLRKVDEFNALHQVEFAEPNIRFELDLSWLPNDERYADQWYLAKIGINRAWEAGFTFSRGVVVAIADTGVDLGHPDLMENLIGGWDFVNNDPEPEDNIGHGTFATGLIGAVGDNGQGISGISWRASLLPLKVADREAWYEAIWRFFRRLFGKGDDFIEAMEWLLELKDNEVNIRVINFSARTTRDSEALRKVIKEVTGEDILFVTVSGNRLEGGWNTDQEGQGIYPCNYPIENLICVGASTEDDGLAGFSNYGPESVDLVAPGVGIISLVPRAGGLEVPMLQRGWSKRVDSLTGLSSGTSFSAALVSGVATLLFAVCPEKDAFEIKELILESTEQNGNLEDKISRGRLRWPKLAMLREEGCNVSPEL
jgi:parallel beta-helix repeat protein